MLAVGRADAHRLRRDLLEHVLVIREAHALVHARGFAGLFQRRLAVERPGTTGGIELGRAHAQHDLRGPLDQDLAPAALLHQHRLVLGGGIEGQLHQPLDVAVEDAPLEPGHAQRDLRGVTADVAAVDVGVVAVVARREQAAQGVLAGPVHGHLEFEAAALAERIAGHPVDDPAGQHPRHRHAVFRQRAGLVGADDRRGAEGFRRGQAPDERLLAGHDDGGEGENRGDQRRQHGRDRGYYQGHGAEEAVAEREAEVETVDEVGQADDGNGDGQAADEVRDLALQRRGPDLGAAHQVGDAAEGGLAAGGADHRVRRAEGDVGAGEPHVALVAGHQVVAAERRRHFLYRDGLAGERGLVGVQVADAGEAQVRGNLVTGLEQDHVPGNEVAGCDGLLHAVADHHALLHQHAAQRVEGAFGLALLHETEDGVEKDHAEDHDRVRQHLAAEGRQRAGEQAGGEEDEDHGVLELAQEAHPRRGLAEGEFVGSVALETLRGFGGGEAAGGRLELREDRIDLELVNGLRHGRDLTSIA